MVPGNCTNVLPANPPINVKLPDGSYIRSTHTGLLQLPGIPASARRASIFPDLKSGSLLSIGQLCSAGCIATFDSTTVRITKNSQIIAIGHRTPNGLWTIDLETNPTIRPGTALVANNCTAMAHPTASAYMAFLHGAAGYPVLSTWLRAIDAGYFATWPGLTVNAVKRYLPKSAITSLGHMDQARKNSRSTKTANHSTTEPEPEVLPTDLPTTRKHDVYVSCQPLTGKIYGDLTGRFVAESSRGMKYLLILYDADSNAILAEPIKNREARTIVAAYKVLLEQLKAAGLTPRLLRLDNEASAALSKFLPTENIEFQFVPPHVHRRNAAERAIRTFKNHFIAILCGTDPNFPIHLWDRLLPQALLTLNLLRASRINPRLSAYAQIHGAFDFNRTPLGPLGTKVCAHIKPSIRDSWGLHSAFAWYIGPSPLHYRCYKVYTIETGGTADSDSMEWFPVHTPLPKKTPYDEVSAAARALIVALRNPAPTAPFASFNTEKLSALNDLATFFKATTDDALPRVAAPLPDALPRVEAPLPDVLPRVEARLPRQPRGPPLNQGTFAYATRNAGMRRRAAASAKAAATVASTPTANHLQVDPALHFPAPPAAATPTWNASGSTGGTNPILDSTSEWSGVDTRANLDNPTANYFQFDPTLHIPVANAVIHPETGKALTFKQLINDPKTRPIWMEGGCANEIGRLAQGLKGTDIKGTNTIHFIRHDQLPKDKKATYLNIVVDYKPNKADPHRVRFTVGGNLIDYPGPVSTPTCDQVTAKLVINSTLSTPGATFHCFDISNFYLGTPMERYEYMRIPTWALPDCIIEEYNLAGLIHNGYVLVEIRRGMYGLPQSGQLAYEQLVRILAPFGYAPVRHTPGLWRHETRPILFSLCVDDFGVKTVGRKHAEHLLAALRTKYGVTTDWEGEKYLGLTIKWDYQARTADLSMPGYIAAAIHRFQHVPSSRPEHSPHAWTKPQFGAPTQLTAPTDTSPRLDAEGVTRVQQILGTLLHYARAVDSTMLVALSSLASQQTKSTETTAKAITKLLNYCATHPDATIRYHASDMILQVVSDASYNSEPGAKSRVGGHLYLSHRSSDPTKAPIDTPLNNGAILTISNIMKNVMSSAAESEVGGLFHNAKEAVPIRTTLAEMGHPQPPTPIQTDNSMATGFANEKIRQRRSRAMDMRFYWLQDRIRQNQFLVYWKPGAGNLGDYHTKHHSPAHHQLMRPVYLHDTTRGRRMPCKGVLIPPPGSPPSDRYSGQARLRAAQARLTCAQVKV
jgi:hypothetical protein